MSKFDYHLAFSRNLGWLTDSEQGTLSQKRVAIAGMGGVGGHYCEVLARMGIRRFHLADFDRFEVQNFNRQSGAAMSTLGQEKIEVMRQRILDINPEAEIKMFKEGLTPQNLGEFLQDVDVYLDGLDFFVLNERLWLFAELRQKRIPAITIAPVGMGAAALVFDDKSMSFSDYFGYTESMSDALKAAHFLAGLTPSLMQRHYNVDPSRADFKRKKVPSTAMGCYLSAGVAGSLVTKILLERGQVLRAPWVQHYDAYLMKYKKSYSWLGAKSPLRKLKIYLLKKKLGLLEPWIDVLQDFGPECLDLGLKAESGNRSSSIGTTGDSRSGMIEPRFLVQIRAKFQDQPAQVVNISRGGLALELMEGAGFGEIQLEYRDRGRVQHLTLQISPSEELCLEVSPVWQKSQRMGMRVLNPPEGWEELHRNLNL